MEQTASTVSATQSMAGTNNSGASATTVVPSGPYLDFLTDYHIGDHAGMLGLLVSVVGLWLTYNEAKKSRTAAEAARDAAKDARRGRLLVDVSMDLAAIYDQLVRLKQTVRGDEWGSISGQIDALCRDLEAVRQAMLDGSTPDFSDSECGVVADASAKLREFENLLTRKNAKPPNDAKSEAALQRQVTIPLTTVIDSVTSLQHKARLISGKR
ncbi:hypothetical protein [Trinickia sp.]|uniref:hypothetical protein n=1 Tax=Trinickia sp. TaxID=2571163 RepID=UPI003F7D2BCA